MVVNAKIEAVLLLMLFLKAQCMQVLFFLIRVFILILFFSTGLRAKADDVFINWLKSSRVAGVSVSLLQVQIFL